MATARCPTYSSARRKGTETRALESYPQVEKRSAAGDVAVMFQGVTRQWSWGNLAVVVVMVAQGSLGQQPRAHRLLLLLLLVADARSFLRALIGSRLRIMR